MSISAMKQALDDICGAKLCEVNSMSSRAEMIRLMDKAITALRQAIAEAEDEPRHISYACPNCHWSLDKQVRTHTPEDIKKIESKWVSLTDEEIKEIVGPWGDATIKGYTRKLFDAIEAKLREKNA